MDDATATPEELFATIVDLLLAEPGVTYGGKGFGGTALKVQDKIFAMLVRGQLVVKLPRARVAALVASGVGEPFDPRKDGRLMKEWLVVAPASSEEWLALSQAALTFVRAGQLQSGGKMTNQ